MTENKMPSFINIDSCFISFVPDLVWLFSYVILKSSQDFNIERLVDSTDLRSLDTQPGHQAALVKGKGIDAAMHGIGSEAAGHSFVHDDDARAGADLPAARVIYPIHRLLIHEEEGVTVFLDTGLQAIGGCYRPVDAFAALRAKNKPCLNHIWKDKDGQRSR